MEKTPTDTWIARGITLAVGFLLAISIYGVWKEGEDNKANSKAIDFANRESQYTGCILGANSLRQQVRTEFVDLKLRGIVPVFAQVRNTIPPSAVTYHILDKAVKRLHRRAGNIGKRIPNIHCLQRYPPLPGQTFPSKEKIKSIARELAEE